MSAQATPGGLCRAACPAHRRRGCGDRQRLLAAAVGVGLGDRPDRAHRGDVRGRRALLLPVTRAADREGRGTPPIEPEALAVYLDSRVPDILAAIGGLGLLVLVWLMVMKPELIAPRRSGDADHGRARRSAGRPRGPSTPSRRDPRTAATNHRAGRGSSVTRGLHQGPPEPARGRRHGPPDRGHSRRRSRPRRCAALPGSRRRAREPRCPSPRHSGPPGPRCRTRRGSHRQSSRSRARGTGPARPGGRRYVPAAVVARPCHRAAPASRSKSTMSVNRIVARVRSSSSSGAIPKLRALANSTASNAVSPTTHAS